MLKKFLYILSLVFLFTSKESVAKNNTSNVSNENALFDSEIFSLSKKKEDAFDAASATYIITSEDIRRSGATSIPEALRLVPGLQVAKIDGHKWAISARGFNGQYSNKLLIMIDGRTVYTPVFSGGVWETQDYVLEDIEKIEVVKGPGGTIWGANAVNGVINIITKSAVLTQGSHFSAISGNTDKFIGEARYGGKTTSNDHYRIYAKQVNRDGETKLSNGLENEDGYKQSQAGFRYDVRSVKDSNISIHGDARDGKSKNYFQTVSALKPLNKDSKGGNLVINWDKTISNKSSFTLQTYMDYDQFDTYLVKRGSKTYDVDFQHFYDFSRENQFIWGAGYRLIEDDMRENKASNGLVLLNYEPDQRKDEIFSAFIQDKIGLIADKLYLTLGSKFEKNDFTGFEYQPNAKLALYPTRNQTVWASVSRAVRTPTRAEDGLTTIGSPTQKGNVNYNSETVMAYELGYRIKPIRTVLIDLATFYNEYDRLRTFELDSPGTAYADNLGEGKSYGFELTSKWQATTDWKLEAGYDFLKIDLRTKPYSTDTSSPAIQLALGEGQSPKNQFRIRSYYNITPKIEFDNSVYYVDSLPLSGSTTNPDGSSNGAGSISNGVPAYVRWDSRIGYLPTSNLELSFAVQNITDKRHQEFGPGLASYKTEVGRTFYFKTVFGF